MSGQSGGSPSHVRPWQDSLRTTSQALPFLLASGIHSDVTLVVGKEGKQFKAHRLILAMRSSVLEELLILKPAMKGGVLPMREDSPPAAEWLLNHIYCDHSNLDDIDLALQVLSMADKYMLATAYDISIKFLHTAAKRNNILKIYKYLIHLFADNDSLKSLCRRMFEDNGNAVLVSPALLDLTPEALGHLLHEPLTVTSEAVLFKALLTWGQAQVRLKGKESTAQLLRQEVSQFLPLVRFLTMTSEEFVQTVVTSDVLTPDECVFVLKGIVSPEADISLLSPLSSSLRLSTSRISRAISISEERARRCVCDSPNKEWLRHSTYQFVLMPSDNLILLALDLKLHGGDEKVQVELRWEEGRLLASAETCGGSVSFASPPHLREGASYQLTIHLLHPETALLGNPEEGGVFQADEFSFTLSHGVFVHALVFF